MTTVTAKPRSVARLSKLGGRVLVDVAAPLAVYYGLRAFDVGPLTLDVGLEVGGATFAQAFHDPLTRDRTSFGPFVGALGQLELPLPHRLYARLEVAGLFYFMHTSDTAAMSTAPTYRCALGVGVSF